MHNAGWKGRKQVSCGGGGWWVEGGRPIKRMVESINRIRGTWGGNSSPSFVLFFIPMMQSMKEV